MRASARQLISASGTIIISRAEHNYRGCACGTDGNGRLSWRSACVRRGAEKSFVTDNGASAIARLSDSVVSIRRCAQSFAGKKRSRESNISFPPYLAETRLVVLRFNATNLTIFRITKSYDAILRPCVGCSTNDGDESAGTGLLFRTIKMSISIQTSKVEAAGVKGNRGWSKISEHTHLANRHGFVPNVFSLSFFLGFSTCRRWCASRK